MKKRKLIALFLVVILIFAIVAGCSKETDEKEDPKPTATQIQILKSSKRKSRSR